MSSLVCEFNLQWCTRFTHTHYSYATCARCT